MDNLFEIPAEAVAAYQGKKILISGGQGYLGSGLTQALCGLDCQVVVLNQSQDPQWMSQISRSNLSFVQADVSLSSTWETVLAEVDYIFYLASLECHGGPSYDMMRDLRVNALAVLHLIETCRERNLYPKIIFSSSANLFGHTDTLPLNENCRDDPSCLWSVHKQLAENYLRVYSQQYGIPSVILRLANVYGPTSRQEKMGQVVINKVISKALETYSLVTYANRSCIRDYIFLDDVLRAFLMAGASEAISCEGHFYVIGSGEAKKIKEVWQLIANKVEACTGQNVSIEFDETAKMDPLSMRNFVADTTLFCEATGWKPEIFLDRGVELTIEALISKCKR